MDSQSALSPAGPQAARIDALWWYFLAVASVVVLIVTALLLVGLVRASRQRGTGGDAADVSPEEGGERRRARVVTIGIAITAVVLLTSLVATVRTMRALDTPPSRDQVVIELVGYQWWWGVRYADTSASRYLETANEIHVPVGRPVELRLNSRDVIHSFWAPNLHGKRDLVPGHPTSTWFQADTPGVYRAQCAEFCGWQHARMALTVTAEPESAFRAWYDRQLQPAADPSNELERRGQEVFLATTCVMCHTVRGTAAASRVGPDLTHVGSRPTIAAGTLPNTAPNLTKWIANPHSIKPGTRMPSTPLSPSDLQALVAYLQHLK